MSLASETQRQRYQSEGYFILEHVLPDAHVEMLRRERALHQRH